MKAWSQPRYDMAGTAGIFFYEVRRSYTCPLGSPSCTALYPPLPEDVPTRQGTPPPCLCCPARVTSFTMAETLLSQQPMFLSVRESSGTDDSQPARLWCALIYGPENSHGTLCLRPSALTFGQGQTSCPSFSRCPSFFRGPSSTPRPPLLAHFQKHREWKKGSSAALAHFHIALRERCRQTVMTEP